jgi:hypothetical protein
MIYAHWEGYVKRASTEYLRYVAEMCELRGVDQTSIAPEYAGLVVWQMFKETQNLPEVVAMCNAVRDFHISGIFRFRFQADSFRIKSLR